MAEEKVYVDGAWFNPRHTKQPDFVIGNMTFLREKFMQWLDDQQVDGRGYVRVQILQGREKPYMTLDTYKPLEKPEFVKAQEKPEEQVIEYPEEEDINPDDIPF